MMGTYEKTTLGQMLRSKTAVVKGIDPKNVIRLKETKDGVFAFEEGGYNFGIAESQIIGDGIHINPKKVSFQEGDRLAFPIKKDDQIIKVNQLTLEEFVTFKEYVSAWKRATESNKENFWRGMDEHITYKEFVTKRGVSLVDKFSYSKNPLYVFMVHSVPSIDTNKLDKDNEGNPFIEVESDPFKAYVGGAMIGCIHRDILMDGDSKRFVVNTKRANDHIRGFVKTQIYSDKLRENIKDEFVDRYEVIITSAIVAALKRAIFHKPNKSIERPYWGFWKEGDLDNLKIFK